MYTFVWFSGAIWETPSKKTAVILSHRYVIGVKIVLRANLLSYVKAPGSCWIIRVYLCILLVPSLFSLSSFTLIYDTPI